jgi:hypothetical protein
MVESTYIEYNCREAISSPRKNYSPEQNMRGYAGWRAEMIPRFELHMYNFNEEWEKSFIYH